MPPVHCIINPASGGGRTARRIDALQAAIERRGIEATYAFTQYRGHGIDLAALAIEEGYETIVACGGDGTVNEVANAVLNAGVADRVRIGTIPMGTGKDIGKCLGMPTGVAGLRAVAAGNERRIDVGLVEAKDAHGDRQDRYFLLEAAAGWIPEISAAVPRWLKLLGDTSPYVIMAFVKMAGPMHREFAFTVDGDVADDRYNSISVHNMEFWGGDLLAAPGADPADGRLDVVRWGPLSRRRILDAIAGQRNGGTHVDIDGIDLGQATELTLDSPKRTAIDIDGEQGGYLPARFSIVPGALRFIAP